MSATYTARVSQAGEYGYDDETTDRWVLEDEVGMWVADLVVGDHEYYSDVRRAVADALGCDEHGFALKPVGSNIQGDPVSGLWAVRADTWEITID